VKLRRLEGRGLVARRAIGGRIGCRVGLGHRLVVSVGLLAVAGHVRGQGLLEGVARGAECDTVLRALGPGEARLDRIQVEPHLRGEGRLFGVLVVPQPLLPGVGVDQCDLLARAPGELEVVERLGVDWKDRAGGPELGRHVSDRRAVGERQAREAGAVKLDEHAHHPPLAQHLRDGQHEVGRGRALRELAAQLEAEHLRDQHRHRLAEHRRLGLDPAHAPAEHAQAVDHRGVRVGAHEGVGVGLAAPRRRIGEHDPGEVLEVDLVHDPRVGGHDGEVGERALAPAQEGVALAVAFELPLGVHAKGLARAERVDLHRVVDHQLGRHERVDLGGVAA
jgi:hypothetical protein